MTTVSNALESFVFFGREKTDAVHAEECRLCLFLVSVFCFHLAVRFPYADHLLPLVRMSDLTIFVESIVDDDW